MGSAFAKESAQQTQVGGARPCPSRGVSAQNMLLNLHPLRVGLPALPSHAPSPP